MRRFHLRGGRRLQGRRRERRRDRQISACLKTFGREWRRRTTELSLLFVVVVVVVVIVGGVVVVVVVVVVVDCLDFLSESKNSRILALNFLLKLFN